MTENPASPPPVFAEVHFYDRDPITVFYPSGPRGPMFKPDAQGPLAGRAAYDDEVKNFAYVATDQDPPLLYFKQEAAGVWSTGIRYGRGEKGETGDTAYELAVAQGFDGDIDEWLESLIGPQGDPASGSHHNPPQILLASGAIDPEKDLIKCDTSNTNINVTLPNATAYPDQEYTIKNTGTGSNLLTLLPASGSGQLIEGLASLTTRVPGDLVTVRSDSGNWTVTSPPTVFAP